MTEQEIEKKFFQLLKEIVNSDTIEINKDTNLIGSSSVVDSMKLVELCLALEDFAGEIGFQFDWTSETAMSRSRSIFRTTETLLQEFLLQRKDSK